LLKDFLENINLKNLMNIAFIIQDYNYHGGAQKTANLAEHLQSLGHSVDIIVIRCREGDVESRPNHFLNILDLNATGLFSSISKLTKIFRDSRYDACISIGANSNLFAGLAKFLSRSSTPVIGSENFATSVLIGDYPKVFLRLSLPLFRFAYTKLNGLVFVSDKLRLEFLKKNSWHPSRCIRIYNPIRSPKKKPKENVKSKVDVLVLTSNSEAFGMVLVEGLAAGLQVVSTNSFSGPAEVLGDGRYGFLAEVDDVNSIASSMKAAINSPISQEIIHEGASRFSIDSIVKKYLEFITIVKASDGNLDDPI